MIENIPRNLFNTIYIEEDSRNIDRKDDSSEVNVNVNKNNQKNKNFKKNGHNPKYQNNKKDHCFVCGKHRHRCYISISV